MISHEQHHPCSIVAIGTLVLAITSHQLTGQELLKPAYQGLAKLKKTEVNSAGEVSDYQSTTSFMYITSSRNLSVAESESYPHVRILLAPARERECWVRLVVKRPSGETEKKLGAAPLLETGPETFLRSADRSGRKTAITTFTGESPSYRNEVECDSIGRANFHWFDVGAEITVRGSVELLGAVVESDPSYPLTFRMTSSGLVLIYGRGKLAVPGRAPLFVGKDEQLSVWLARLKDKNQLHREAAAAALGYLGADNSSSNPVVTALLQALDDQQWQVRRNAAESLGRLSAQTAIPALKKLVEDQSGEGWVSAVAKESLNKLTTK